MRCRLARDEAGLRARRREPAVRMSERFRLEQYLSFMTNIQGMITPPDIDPFEPAKKPAAGGVVESNKLMARLGTIFTTMPVTRPPVAMLYSISHNIHIQTLDRQANYAHANLHGQRLPLTYLAGKLLKHQFLTVGEEDIVDGTLAAHHKAIVLTSIDYLPPKVIFALEDFAAHGGQVMLTADWASIRTDSAMKILAFMVIPLACLCFRCGYCSAGLLQQAALRFADAPACTNSWA
mgnify:CR=1 FL=1